MDLSRDALYAAFGASSFALPQFYNAEPALRFELSLSGEMLDQFEQAWDRGREVVDYAFGDARELIVVISAFTDGPRMPYLDIFRSLRRLRVKMERPRAAWTEPYHDPVVEGPDTLAFMAFPCGRDALHRLLWGAFATWLGIKPHLGGNLYVASPERGIVAQPYDDRGMDIAGPNHALLAELYTRFNGYLLDYDRDRMRAFFEPAPRAD